MIASHAQTTTPRACGIPFSRRNAKTRGYPVHCEFREALSPLLCAYDI